MHASRTGLAFSVALATAVVAPTATSLPGEAAGHGAGDWSVAGGSAVREVVAGGGVGVRSDVGA